MSKFQCIRCDDGSTPLYCLKCAEDVLLDRESSEPHWVLTSDRLPELGQMVWLYEGKRIWIGSRDDADGDGWLWGNSYGYFWHNGEKWDGDSEQDDDYRPTHWMPLPDFPKQSDETPGAA